MLAVISIAVVESVAVSQGDYVIPRLLGSIGLLGGVHIAAAVDESSSYLRRLLPRWSLLGGLLVVGGAGVFASEPLSDVSPLPGAGTVPALELATVPLAIVLIVSGLLHLDRAEQIGSWRTVGPGLLVLLVPSLLMDFDVTALWRVVALGVVAFAVLLWGLMARLQAPFVLGGLVFAVHGLAQLWPWISSIYLGELWWLWWLGIGGIVLIVVAARLEHRIKNLKDAVRYVGSLR